MATSGSSSSSSRKQFHSLPISSFFSEKLSSLVNEVFKPFEALRNCTRVQTAPTVLSSSLPIVLRKWSWYIELRVCRI